MHNGGVAGGRQRSSAAGPERGRLLGDEHSKRQAAQTVLGRMAAPDVVARAVAFFADEDSGFVTGTIAAVNGGGTWE
ncbi:SDR family oxidoreductase [Streptomyces sp. NPDC059466]|uniref:SDR family oxidoreductase n=1 Tax=unclassified Streptomyces TaxID=2593676 RepID=UPI00369E008D